MNILLYLNSKMPVENYGGTQRVVWDLANSLNQLGHDVTLLAPQGTKCSFAHVIEIDSSKNPAEQIPHHIDVIHAHSGLNENLTDKPIVRTQHGNSANQAQSNTIFVSKNHAQRHGGSCFVHNGLNWDNYDEVQLNSTRDKFHFLGKAAWRVKNVQGAIDIARRAGQRLDVMGGHRFNFKMGIRLTLDRHVKFHGMVGDKEKSKIMNHSKGLIFPVTWHEPFGLAITESLYFGCPIFASPYGSLSELVTEETGFLSSNESDLVQAIQNSEQYSPRLCHEYARDLFDANTMAKKYLSLYEKVLNGEKLNLLDENWKPTPSKKLPYQK